MVEAHVKEGDLVDLCWRRRVGGERNDEAGSDNNEPDQPHAAGSLAEGHDPHQRAGVLVAAVFLLGSGTKVL